MSEMLSDVLGNVAIMKTLPDADLEWLVELETMILAKLRQPLDEQSSGFGAPPGGGAPPVAPVPPGGGVPAPPLPPQDVPGGPGAMPIIPPEALQGM